MRVPPGTPTRRTRRQAAYLRVIHRLWTRRGKVTHRDFSRALGRAHAHMGPELRRLTPPLAPKAFSYWLKVYLRQQGIHRRPRPWLRNTLVEAIQKGAIHPDLRDAELLATARHYLLGLRVVVPLDGPLRTLVRSARAEVAGRRHEKRLAQVEQDLGVTLRGRTLKEKAEAALRLRQYPPVWKGKPNLQTMGREHRIMLQLDSAIRAEGISREKALASPDLERHRRLFERVPPSQLGRREKHLLAEAAPHWTVARWRDARDRVLHCHVRSAHHMAANLEKLEGKALRDASLSFLERSTPKIRALHRTFLRCLETGRAGSLAQHRTFVADLAREGLLIEEDTVYYALLSNRGGHSRKMSLRLKGIPFEPHDAKARAVVEAFREVCRFARFRVPVPEPVVESLTAFLDVRPDQMRRRKVFEPTILMTLADLLWSGRVTVPGSRLYRDRWKDLPPPSPPPEGWTPARWVADLRRRLEAAGALFRQRARGRDVIREGRLRVPRPRKVRTEEDEEGEETSSSSVNLPPVSIDELLWKVHDATGFLDAFQLSGSATHRLSEDERRRLALGVLLMLVLNLGYENASRALGRGFAVWRLRNFEANYVTEANLWEALDRIVRAWDRLGLGKAWGPGTTCTVDGRALQGAIQNLVSEKSFRRRVYGMVLYWAVRDDYMAVSVRLIPNSAWESWFILDDLVHPAGGQALEASTGDTHGQHLAAFGLAYAIGKRLTIRFRQVGQVKIYGPHAGSWYGLDHVGAVDWGKVRRAAPSILRLAEAVKAGKVVPSEFLSKLNVYDEEGVNVMEGLRELGKIARTEFLLSYATDPELQKVVHRQREQMESWNSFEKGVSIWRGGQVLTNNPERWGEIGLAKAVVLSAIVFANVWEHGARLRRVPTAKPTVWRHVELIGRFRGINRRPPRKTREKFRKMSPKQA